MMSIHDRVWRARLPKLQFASTFLILAMLTLPSCSWPNVIVLVYTWSPSPSTPAKLPNVIARADGSALLGQPVAECPGAVQYFVAGTSNAILIAKVQVFTTRLELASSSVNVYRYELVTLSDGNNLPSGAIDEELMQRADVERALRASDGFIRDLSSHTEFRGLLPGFVGRVVKGRNLISDLGEYCHT